MTDCLQCLIYEREIEQLRDALAVMDRALRLKEGRIEKLRAQLRKLTTHAGIVQGYTVREIAERCGRLDQTVRVWMIRSANTGDPFPAPIPNTYPHLYDRATIEDWLSRHKRLLRRDKRLASLQNEESP